MIALLGRFGIGRDAKRDGKVLENQVGEQDHAAANGCKIQVS